MADFLTNRGALVMGHKGATNSVTYTSDTIKIGLLKSSAAPDRTINFVSDLVPATNEISVSGYSRQTLGSKTVTEVDGGTNQIQFDAADALFSALASGQTVGWAFVYKEVTVDGDSPVICILDLTDTATNGGDITVQFAAAGVFTLNT
jgi:hypothetical protein